MSRSTSYYRFVAGNQGVYEAVERDCPRSDLRRNLKPDGSWLSRVGEKFPGAISFWTEHGLEKYFMSGLQEWHRSVVADPLFVLTATAIQDSVYEDPFQIICQSESVCAQRIPWEEFSRSRLEYPMVKKVQACIIRGRGADAKLLVFEHDKQWGEAGIQVPAGTVDAGESLEAAALREAEEECGLADLRIVKKIDEYIHFRHTHRQFNHRYVFLMETADRRDSWVHKVAGHGEDQGMNFHYSWMPLPEAEHRLAGTQGCSIRRLG